MRNVTFRFSLCLTLLVCLAACGPRKPESRAPAEPPQAAPTGAPADAEEYLLVPGESEIRILAYRDGPLAALGHNHVISTTAITGKLWLATPVSRSVVDLSFPVTSLEVDIPAQREEEGEDFPGVLDESAIDGTRSNMLGEKVLQADRFPRLQIRSREIRGELPDLRLLVDVSVRGQTTPVEIPVTVTQSGGRVSATGSFSVKQSELGLEPFSVGLGALIVRDQLDLKYRLVAGKSPEG